MLTHRRLFLSLALSALVGLIATSGARAESISMTITGGGGPILVDTFITGGASSTVYGTVDLTLLNTALTTAGYAYQFTALGGGSNWAGTSAQGTMNVSGGLSIPAGKGGFTDMTITETEAGFTDPSSLGPGILMSSSSANFTNQAAGFGHKASSAFNLTSTPTYSVLSTGLAVNPGVNGGPVSTGVGPPVPTLYMLTNVITFGLTPSAGSDVTDSFGVTATITAQSVPEPASLVTMLLGIPLPLVVLGLLRRRRLARA